LSAQHERVREVANEIAHAAAGDKPCPGFDSFIQFKRKDQTMSRILRLVLPFMILALFVTGAPAQTVTTGSISGVVTDQSGGVVPDITVTATSPNLIQPQSATTGPDGRYSIFNLPPGKYMVTAEAQKGFVKIQQGNIDVNLGKTATVTYSFS